MKEADSTSGCTVKAVSGRLKTERLGRTLLFLSDCTSTNDAGREYASKGRLTLMDIRRETIDCSNLVCEILLGIEDLLALAASDHVPLLELLRRNDSSFVDYESIDNVGIATIGELIAVNTASVRLVEYLS